MLYYPQNLNNTFQAVMATDGESSFISFVYVDIQWGAGAHIGLSDGGGVEYITESISFTNATINMDLMSNVNISGVFFYRVDGKGIKGANFTLMYNYNKIHNIHYESATVATSMTANKNTTFMNRWN